VTAAARRQAGIVRAGDAAGRFCDLPMASDDHAGTAHAGRRVGRLPERRASGPWGPGDVIQHLKDSADKLASLALVCSEGNRLNIRRAVEGPLSIVAPADGATLKAGQSTAIRWANAYKSAKLAQVKIEFSPDDGATWPATLVAATANDGRWDWTPGTGHNANQGWIPVTPVAGNFSKVVGDVQGGVREWRACDVRKALPDRRRNDAGRADRYMRQSLAESASTSHLVVV